MQAKERELLFLYSVLTHSVLSQECIACESGDLKKDNPQTTKLDNTKQNKSKQKP